MIKLPEMMGSHRMELHDGAVSTTTEVWATLSAARSGNLDELQALISRQPALLTCQYDYTSPLHLAVREGHLEVVRYLVQGGALDPSYRVHPFLESITAFAEDRSFEGTTLLKKTITTGQLTREWGDTGRIHHERDDAQHRFEKAINQRELAVVEAMLRERPDLAKDELAFWGEGVLAMPAKDGDHRVIELLLSYGASVPNTSKWGARYYFKHYATAAFLLKNGMDPNHMNWRRFTLLHEMAFLGDTQKATLLLDYGAAIDAIDDEYQSTPLGYACHWGQSEMVRLLISRGADVMKAGKAWATPLAWASKKGFSDIARVLRTSGAGE